MTINSINHSEAVSKYINTTGSPASKAAPAVSRADSVELSEGAQKVSSLIKNAKEALKASGSDEDVKVADIVARLNNHTYNVSTDDVVNDILSGAPSGSTAKKD